MNVETLQKAGLIYEEAVALPAEDRDAFLRMRCEGDPELEAQVFRLFEAEALEREANRSALGGLAPQSSGRMFGQYRATGIVGQGGMGTVYRAERADGQFVRQAAVKVVNGATVNDELNIRFLNERQILAHLEHPNIARLLDGGVTEQGEPFLVMEYVEGEPIDKWCDQRRLSIRARIQLFLKVLSAVDFAHRQFIVHRDIKPSNVLVDQHGEPRLLDFGTAKMLGPAQLAKTQQFLTPRYASPEQLRSQPASVSMDVYSLGVLLYELLTGQWPFGDPGESNRNFARAMGQVRATVPSSTTSGAAAESRGVTVRQLREQLSGDISFVLMRALEADPQQRYGSVRDFADDLNRYLNGYPVQAREQSKSYLIRRWVARNRWVVATMALVAVSLLTGLILREQQRRLADQRAVELRALGRYQLFDLQDQMAFYGVSMNLRRQAAQRSLDALDRIPAGRAMDTDFRAELAESYARIAEILGNPLRANLGRTAEAKRALAKARELAADLPQSPAYARARLAVLLQQAMFDYAETKGSKPLEDARNLALQWRRQIRPEWDPPEEISHLAATVATLVQVARNAGGTILNEDFGSDEIDVAESLVETAIRRAPDSHHLLQTRYSIRLSQAESLASKNPAQGIPALLAIPAAVDKLPPAVAAARTLRYIKGQAFSNAGWFQGQAKLYDDAIASLEAAAGIFERIANDDPQQMNAYFDLAGCYRALGFVNEYAERPQAAVQPLRKAIRAYDVLLASSPNEGIRMVRGEVLVRLAKDLQKSGAIEEARQAGDQGLQALIELASRPNATLNQLINAARYLLDPPLAQQKDPGKALELARRAIAMAPNNVFVQELFSLAAEQDGNLAGAVEAARKRLELTPESNGPARELALKRLRELEGKLASR
jgi:serine/threonine protein kinase/tetratricopeptide (TPR) repeat protein